MILFNREPLTRDLFNEAAHLLQAHYEEIAAFQDIELKPDIEQYLAMETLGMIQVYTARDSITMDLRGYALFMVRRNLHYSDSLQAVQDVLFIAKEERGTTGYRFIKYCDTRLHYNGVQVVYQHVKTAHNFGSMLERIGYTHVENIYARRLDV